MPAPLWSCPGSRVNLQLTASNEGASTMCSRVHLLANPSSPRLSPGGTNLFIADGLTYVVPVFIQPPRLLRAGSSPPGRVSSELVVQFQCGLIRDCTPNLFRKLSLRVYVGASTCVVWIGIGQVFTTWMSRGDFTCWIRSRLDLGYLPVLVPTHRHLCLASLIRLRCLATHRFRNNPLFRRSSPSLRLCQLSEAMALFERLLVAFGNPLCG